MCIIGPHGEAFVDLGPGGQSSAMEKQLLCDFNFRFTDRTG
jgi:hypothetical protein